MPVGDQIALVAQKAPGMVTPTIFIWEVIQKFFFLTWSFISWQLKKIICMVVGDPHGPGAFWLILGLKNRYFRPIYP